MKTKVLSSIIVSAVTVFIAAGCDLSVRTPDADVIVSGPPPAPQVDVETPVPGPDYVWIGGSWVWGPGDHWEWEKGRWDHRPHAGALWAPNHYEYRNGRHTFERGHWR